MKLWELLPLALLGTRLCWMSSAQGTSTSAAAVTGSTTSAWTTVDPAVTNKDANGASNNNGNGKGKPSISTISTTNSTDTNSTDTSGGTNSTSSGSSGGGSSGGGGSGSSGSGSSGSSGSGTTTQPQKGNSAGGGCSFSSIGLLLCSIMVQLTWSC
ncbi:dermokine-like [Poecilia latipinna]|uniref:dermokine-like n=1 Tax=Poecilia formosa TaxID=48698 RepID=UPI000443C2B2|nr:PREDICTED: dermokine-like [Poecilia formosa]XP_014914096.1 PREDICTED: dermokine-like [Poecilia latipinna]